MFIKIAIFIFVFLSIMSCTTLENKKRLTINEIVDRIKYDLYKFHYTYPKISRKACTKDKKNSEQTIKFEIKEIEIQINLDEKENISGGINLNPFTILNLGSAERHNNTVTLKMRPTNFFTDDSNFHSMCLKQEDNFDKECNSANLKKSQCNFSNKEEVYPLKSLTKLLERYVCSIGQTSNLPPCFSTDETKLEIYFQINAKKSGKTYIPHIIFSPHVGRSLIDQYLHKIIITGQLFDGKKQPEDLIENCPYSKKNSQRLNFLKAYFYSKNSINNAIDNSSGN